jgi:hypothetical protein
MTKMYLVTAIILRAALWVMAESAGPHFIPPNSATSSSQQSPAPAVVAAATQSSSPAKRESFLEGCIGGSSSRLTLTNVEGKVYQLRGDTATLAEHVGQHATITGIEEQESASGADRSQPTFTVKKVAFIARICPASK